MEDLRRTIVLLFGRKGGERMSVREFVLSASMDLRWFPPKEAQRLLDLSVKKGLLTVEEGDVEPTFDMKAVEVPMGFVPTPEVLQDAGDLIDRILDEIVRSTSTPRKELAARINAIQRGLGVTIEVAALLAGREVGADLANLHPEVEESLRARRP
ncbi:MAG: DUF2240 family protein [Thermoplasmata archaeon]